MHLQAHASTARTLNLLAVWRKHGDEAEYKAAPFFRRPLLNRAIILKHRLRPHEREVLHSDRTSATKVILPIDGNNLSSGAHSFFVGQTGYKSFLEELSVRAYDNDSYDDKMLRLLDTLPSLDPFLMRERLRREGSSPARCYFDLTEADSGRMFNFVRRELAPLIGISFDDLDVSLNEKAGKLATKILANASDAELEPLRLNMDMSKADFEEGVFCWKGFIYYKWTLADLLPKVRPVAAQIAAIRPTGQITVYERSYIPEAQGRLTRAIGRTCEAVRETLKVYDDAYADLTRNGHPRSFRQFLLSAPNLFNELGERLGAVHHIVSFWGFRFPPGSRPTINAEELVDLLADFEASLSFQPLGQTA